MLDVVCIGIDLLNDFQTVESFKQQASYTPTGNLSLGKDEEVKVQGLKENSVTWLTKTNPRNDEKA